MLRFIVIGNLKSCLLKISSKFPLNKSRSDAAVQARIIPCFKRVVETSSPLKQFALPILCYLAGLEATIYCCSSSTMVSPHMSNHCTTRIPNSAPSRPYSFGFKMKLHVEDMLVRPESTNLLLQASSRPKQTSLKISTILSGK